MSKVAHTCYGGSKHTYIILCIHVHAYVVVCYRYIQLAMDLFREATRAETFSKGKSILKVLCPIFRAKPFQ